MGLARASRWIVATAVVVACSSPEQPTVTTRAPTSSTASTAPAETRDAALALAVAHAAAKHPDITFTIVGETQGGGLNGPWVFQLSPPAPPLLVHYKRAEVIELAPHPDGLQAAVHAWEIRTYGHLQR